MARALMLTTILLLTGCAGASMSTKPSTSEQQLTSVLTNQRDAENAYHTGNLEVAAKLYLQLTRLIPEEANYWYLLGNTYVRMQQPDLAVQAYQQAIMREPKHPRAWHNLGIVRMRQAEAAFVSSASTAKPTDPMRDVSSQLADALAAIGKSSADAEKPLPDTGESAVQPASSSVSQPAQRASPVTSHAPAARHAVPAIKTVTPASPIVSSTP